MWNGHQVQKTLELYVPEPAVKKNPFLTRQPKPEPIVSFEEAKELLPSPIWPANQTAIDACWRAWELAWRNLK